MATVVSHNILLHLATRNLCECGKLGSMIAGVDIVHSQFTGNRAFQPAVSARYGRSSLHAFDMKIPIRCWLSRSQWAADLWQSLCCTAYIAITGWSRSCRRLHSDTEPPPICVATLGIKDSH
jgi:hypothetical protein